jgi:hypothetical protein
LLGGATILLCRAALHFSYSTHTVRYMDSALEPTYQFTRRLCKFGPTEPYSCTQIPRKAKFWADLGDFRKLALENMYFGCYTALLIYGDPRVTVTEPYISPCAYSKRRERKERGKRVRRTLGRAPPDGWPLGGRQALAAAARLV